MARIKEGWYTVERVPEGTTETRYIYDNGEYTVIEDPSNCKVFEGGFSIDSYIGNNIFSPECLAENPSYRYYYPLKRFKIIKKC